MKTFINFVWATLSTLLFPIYISDTSLAFSNSIFSILMFAIIFYTLKIADKYNTDKRLEIYTHILGFLFSFMIAAGYALSTFEQVPLKRLFPSILLFTHVISCLLKLLWSYLITFETTLNNNHPSESPFIIHLSRTMDFVLKHPFIIMILLLLCWTPCFLADFPGGFRYDATAEFSQITHGFNGSFPLLHTVIITRLLPAMYNLTGSYNTGIAVYVIIQMFLIALMYVHMLCCMANKGAHKILIAFLILYCSCFPVIQILVTQSVRDILFSALLTYTMFLFYLMSSDKLKFFSCKRKPFFLGLFLVLTLLSRNNNAGTIMLIIICVVSILMWIWIRKINLHGASIFSITCIASYLCLGTILTSLCQPLSPSITGDSLSIMSQSLARAYVRESDSWTNEELEELELYMNLDDLTYVAENADSTKTHLLIKDNFSDFLVFWCKIGLKHPGCYIDAFLANTQDMWFPSSIVDGYQQTNIKSYEKFDKCYYSIQNKSNYPIVHMDFLPKVLDFYTKIGLFVSFEKIPIISMMFSIGFHFWTILNCMFYIIYRKAYKLLFPVAIILGYTLISAFVPLVLLRYFAAIFFAFPMTLFFTLQPTLNK